MRPSPAAALVALSLVAAACGGGRSTPVPDVPDSVATAGADLVPACRLSVGTDLGAGVVSVGVDVPAAAVLEVGDIIVEADGFEVAVSLDLISVVATKQVGDTLRLVVVRQGEGPLEAEFEVIERSDGSGFPMIGIEVETVVGLRDLLAVDASAIVDSPLTTVVSIQGRLYAMDALAGTWRSLDLDTPSSVWAVSAGGIYVLEEGEPDRIINLAEPGSSIDFAAEGWDSRGVIGSQAGLVLVLANRPADSGVEAAIFAVDPTTGAVAWEWSDRVAESVDSQVSVFALSAPSQGRTLVGTVEFDDDDMPNFLPDLLIDRNGSQVPLERPVSWRARTIYWRSNDEIAYLDPLSLSVLSWNVETGRVEEAALPASTSEAGFVPIGDGSHFIMLTSTGMDLVDGSELGSLRPLAVGCVAEQISAIGYVLG
ncbi:MAG: PDZ domain-containing protein [Actinobacteria bacterium]|nr:PDZ domain-containing protein [Actinomycetota bacterium]